jgi:hypothetical protein
VNGFDSLSYMSYIYMRKHHKEEILVWGSSFRRSLVRGSSPKDSLVRGSSLDEKLPFPMMCKGERFIKCMYIELYAWSESIEACFQGEQWLQRNHD